MGRRTFAVTSVVVLFGTIVAACTGDNPDTGSVEPDGGPSGRPLDENGVGCTSAAACKSGNCIDGFCCESTCSGVCEACNVQGSEGRCLPTKGKPSHGRCDGDESGLCAGACDGTNRAACTYPDVECGKASCTANQATLAARCMAGKCPAATTQACTLGCNQDACLSVKQVAAGADFACALLDDGTVRCWGHNEQGQCGQDAATTVIKRPTEVPSLVGVKAIAAAFSTTCVIMASDSKVKCWGGNARGELGRGTEDGNFTPHPLPDYVSDVEGASMLVGGASLTGEFCAIVTGGGVKCWGANTWGQLGRGTMDNGSGAPKYACAPGSTSTACNPMGTATTIAIGYDNACAALTSGATHPVFCWGRNAEGQSGAVGTGTLYATKVGTLEATALTGVREAFCAITPPASKPLCFGTTTEYGRLGDCATAKAVVGPTPVGINADCSQSLTGVTSLASVGDASCAVVNGAVTCWGMGAGTFLGDGVTDTFSSYAKTKAIMSGAVSVTAGAGFYAIVQNGAERDVRYWGPENYYEAGQGTSMATRATPIGPKW